ncbi:hypothetical protein B0H21DRAFT_707832 [Amylocystis lapponica]|nr:hypothetical protein B0H21DRAFT_707832 [Amylocystis lapponica]
MHLRATMNPDDAGDIGTAANSHVFQVGAPTSTTQRSAQRRHPKASKVAPPKQGQGKGRSQPRIDPSHEIEFIMSVPSPPSRHPRNVRSRVHPNGKANKTNISPLSVSLLAPPPPPTPPARDLLRRAQQTVEVDTDWLGRRPFIMDIILNAMSPAAENSEGVLLEAIGRSQADIPRRDYVFTDKNSVDQYWTDQAVLWRGIAVEPAPYLCQNRYPVSAERSTAAWVADEDDSQQALDDCRATSSSGAYSDLAIDYGLGDG